MTKLKENLKRAALLLVVSLTAVWSSVVSARQPNGQDAPADKFLNSKVPEFEMRGENLLDGLRKLAHSPEPFGFGFEIPLKRKFEFADPDSEDYRFDFRLQNKTIQEILDALCEADPRYTWSTDEGTVNVFPRAIINDDQYLLNRKLDKFELKNATKVDDGLFAIARQLPPPFEQVAHMQFGGDDRYPAEPWTVVYQNLTVRQVVNRLSAHGDRCGQWTFGGGMDFRAFAFFNTYVCRNKSDAEVPKPPDARDANTRPLDLRNAYPSP
ncbi:MAG: hypothetical protein WA734_17890 [Candidatus Acidiferrales bacterium]